MPTGRFGGRVAVVTGAGSGPGRAAARRRADEGAEVLLLDRDAEAAHDAASELPGATAHEPSDEGAS